MKKILVLLITCVMMFSYVNVIYAKDDMPYEVEEVLEEFISDLNDGDEDIYKIIDENNTEITSNVHEYLNGINIMYQVIESERLSDEYYKITIRFNANGVGWNVSGFTADIEIKKVGSDYIVINTDLFDHIGSENILKFILIIFGIIFGFMVIFAIIVVIAILIYHKKKKAREAMYNNLNNENFKK